MHQSLVGALVRGRSAWIAAIVMGMSLALTGGLKHENVMLGAGAGFMTFGLIMLIASFAKTSA